MIAIIDYGVGNIFSLYNAFAHIGAEVKLTDDPEEIRNADKIVLPGVGAFAAAMEKLKKTGMADLVTEEVKKGKPLLGICLGMQLLFERSFEYGEHTGLGLIKGDIVPMEGVVPAHCKIPHIGWNKLLFPEEKERNPLFADLDENSFVYFVHSYFGSNCDESVIATVEYGAELTAAVAKDQIFGVQFHPEKSGETGMKILLAFCRV